MCLFEWVFLFALGKYPEAELVEGSSTFDFFEEAIYHFSLWRFLTFSNVICISSLPQHQNIPHLLAGGGVVLASSSVVLETAVTQGAEQDHPYYLIV